jgi:hypothetical protein
MFATFGGQVMQEGCVSASAPALRTHPSESSDLVTTLWLAGRGVYRSADDGYGQSRPSSAFAFESALTSTSDISFQRLSGLLDRGCGGDL